MSITVKKHRGITTSNDKIIVLMMSLPEEPENCLVVFESTLNDNLLSSLNSIVNSKEAQSTMALSEVLAKHSFQGMDYLSFLHNSHKIRKIPTSSVTMNLGGTNQLSLKELNMHIAPPSNSLSNAEMVNAINPLENNPLEGQADVYTNALERVEASKQFFNKSLTLAENAVMENKDYINHIPPELIALLPVTKSKRYFNIDFGEDIPLTEKQIIELVKKHVATKKTKATKTTKKTANTKTNTKTVDTNK